MTAVMNCHEAIRELDAALRPVVPEGMDYLLLGGVASAAYCDPSTGFEEGVVFAGRDSDLSTLRENGTRRDIDVLITGVTSEEQDRAAVAAINEAVMGSLEVSVFGFREHSPEVGGSARIKSTAKAWTSNRTVDEQGVWRYELFPLEQAVLPESYRPWQLVLADGSTVQVLHPVGHFLAYTMRSISGIRDKDVAKVAEMRSNVIDALPMMWNVPAEQPFYDWRCFAENIAKALKGNLKPGDPGLAPFTTQRDLDIFRAKGRALAAFERQGWVVKLAQEGPLKKVLDKIVGVK